MKFEVSIKNMNMIKNIMKTTFTIVSFPLFYKCVNDGYDIIVQNNNNIVVFDKIKNRFYIDLKTAHACIFSNFQFQRNAYSHRIQ